MLQTYRINIGGHVGRGPDGAERRIHAGDPENNTIETEDNLLRHNGPSGMPQKFSVVGGERAAPPRVVDLGSMSLTELLAFAKEQDITVTGVKDAAEALALIRDYLSQS